MVQVEQIIKGDQNYLIISYVKEDGSIGLMKYPISPAQEFNWVIHPSRTKTFTGTRSFDNYRISKKKSRKLNKYRIHEIIHQMPEKYQEVIHSYNVPKITSMDIETEVLSQSIPSRDNPREKVLTNAWITDGDPTINVTGLKKLNSDEKMKLEGMINSYVQQKFPNKQYKLNYRDYLTERDMLNDLFLGELPQMSAITGWNFLKFDYDYLDARASLLGIPTKRVSPTQSTYGFYIRDKYAKKRSKEKVGTVVNIPNHKIVFDYMKVFEDFDRSVEIKESGSLDWVANEVTGLPKVKYNGSLMELYEQDYVRYCFYNAIDAILVLLIHEKINTFMTLIIQSAIGKVPIHEANFASSILESLFLSERLKRDQHYYVINTPSYEKYDGAFVKEPAPGFFESILGADYRSLYPSSLLGFNIGMDTYMGQMIDDHYFTHIHTGEKVKIDPEKHIKTRTKAIFTKEWDSVPVSTVKNIFSKRLVEQSLADELDKELQYLKSFVA